MKRQPVLIASLAAGLLAALLTRTYISAREDELAAVRDRFRREYGEMEALCFVKDMGSGSMITLDDLTVCKTYRKGNEGSVLAPDDRHMVTGRRTIGFHRKGEPLRWNDIEGGNPRSGGLAADVKPHFRAMSISVTGPASVSGMVRPGDSVDVIGTFDFPDDEGKLKRGDPVTCTILQKVLVLATGAETAKTRGAGGLGGARDRGYSTVTLSVSPREAEMLAFAEQIKGRLVLTLRNRNDMETEEELPTVDFSRIRQEIENLNKERNPTDRKKRRQRGADGK